MHTRCPVATQHLLLFVQSLLFGHAAPLLTGLSSLLVGGLLGGALFLQYGRVGQRLGQRSHVTHHGSGAASLGRPGTPQRLHHSVQLWR